jgi:delta-aminolevulinic acid dehydratase/porphobilinogen synthase
MTFEEKQALREMRDDMADEADKSLIKKALNYIYDVERKLAAIRVFAKAIEAEAKFKGDE